MRLSADRDSKWYSRHSHHAKAYLNGEEVKHCVLADEEKGIVWVHKTDLEGNIMLNKRKDGTFKICLSGKVEIR